MSTEKHSIFGPGPWLLDVSIPGTEIPSSRQGRFETLDEVSDKLTELGITPTMGQIEAAFKGNAVHLGYAKPEPGREQHGYGRVLLKYQRPTNRTHNEPYRGQWVVEVFTPGDGPTIGCWTFDSLDQAAPKLAQLGMSPTMVDITTAIDEGYSDLGETVLREYANGQQEKGLVSLSYRLPAEAFADTEEPRESYQDVTYFEDALSIRHGADDLEIMSMIQARVKQAHAVLSVLSVYHEAPGEIQDTAFAAGALLAEALAGLEVEGDRRHQRSTAELDRQKRAKAEQDRREGAQRRAEMLSSAGLDPAGEYPRALVSRLGVLDAIRQLDKSDGFSGPDPTDPGYIPAVARWAQDRDGARAADHQQGGEDSASS